MPTPLPHRTRPRSSYRFPARWVPNAVACLLVFPACLDAQSTGGLALAERNPLYDLFYVPRGGGADPLVESSTRFDLTLEYSNIFERSETPTHSQLFDLERLSTTVQVRHGVTSRLEVGGRLTVHTSWEGFLDPLIEGVHGAFNVSNGDRDLVESNGYALRLVERGGMNLVNIKKRAFAPADLHLFGRALLAGGADAPSAVSLRTTLKLPTGVDGTGTGGVDVATELLGRRTTGPWHVHWMAGLTTLNPPEALEELANSVAGLFGFGVERTVTENVSLLLHSQGSTRYVSGIGEDELDDFPLIVGFGVAGSAGSWEWQAAFVEDIPPNSPSADVTLHFQISRFRE